MIKSFTPQTEDQLLERIDRSLAQVDAADEMLEEFLSDSLTGVLKNDYDDRAIRDERIERI